MIEFNSTFIKRFWDKVDKTDTCWNWTAYRGVKGYGHILSNGKGSKMLSVHRASWLLHRGDIPKGKFVLHKCDNPGCVRPDHLELGDHAMNMKQKVARGRASSRVVFLQSEVCAIRDAYAAGVSKQDIARRSGVACSTANNVISKQDYVGRELITLEKLLNEEQK